MSKKTNTPFGHGALKSKIDRRDHKDKSLALATPISSSFKVEWGQVPIRMQYKIGKCVAEAVTRQVEYIYYKKTGQYVKLSDDFLYLITKKYVDGNTTEGTSFRNVLKAAQQYGICTAATFSVPVDENTTYDQYIQNINNIPQQALTEALNYKIGQYLSIPLDIDIIKSAIFKYEGLVARFDVGDTWWTDKNRKSSWSGPDLDPLRKPLKVISGHGIGLDGYNNLIVIPKTQGDIANSWSPEWGYFGYENFIFEDYMPTEAWAITLNPVPPVDKSPYISDTIVNGFIAILRKLGIIN